MIDSTQARATVAITFGPAHCGSHSLVLLYLKESKSLRPLNVVISYVLLYCIELRLGEAIDQTFGGDTPSTRLARPAAGRKSSRWQPKESLSQSREENLP